MTTIALACAAALSLAAGFHFYWGFGGRLGIAVAVPQAPQGGSVFTPRPGSAHLVGVALLMAVAFILAQAGLLALPMPAQLHAGITRAVVALLALIFLVRALGWFRYAGLFKQVRHTPFARCDTWFYSPLCLLLGAGLSYQVLAV